MATWLQQFGDWNTNLNAGIFGGRNAAGVMQQASGFGKAMGSLGIDAGNIGGIANTIGQLGTGLLAGQNQTGIGNAMQTIGDLASNIPGVGGLIGAGVGVVGGLVNAAFGSNINEEFVNQTQMQANAVGNRVFNANTNADVLNDWGNYTEQSLVNQSDVGSDGWFSSKASDKRKELNQQIQEANRRQLANFAAAVENADKNTDFRIMQNMAAYGGPINSFRKYYANGGSFNTPQFFTFEPQTFDDGGYLSKAKALIRQNEGWREKPYADSPKGKNWRSVGYGFNDSGFRDKYPEGISKHYEHGITKKQAEEELDYFLNKAEKQLKSIYGKQWNDFTDSQKAAILDTYYQRPASVGKSSRFYKAVTSGEDPSKYLGVAGFSKRNKIRQGVFGGSQDYVNLRAEIENPSANSSSLQEVTPFVPVVQDLDLSGITPTQAKALELNLASPTFDLSMFGKAMSTPQESQVPTVGTIEDFLASYGDPDSEFFAKGGHLAKPTLTNSKVNFSNQLNPLQQNGDIFKANNGIDMNIFNLGGGMTHGVNWDTGINWVDEGGSHGENPLGGVPYGVDQSGVPNLVEEGEAVWNGDYVFSRRMKVPKKLREKYKLPDDATFADAVKVLTKESEERPNDEISRATQDHILGEFADTQEELRMAKAQRAMDKEIQLQDDFLTGVQFGLGGTLFADGGGIHIDPSKKGTFKAQASKMGMGVQEAATETPAITPEETGAASTRRGSQDNSRGRGNGSGTATRNRGSVVPLPEFEPISFTERFGTTPVDTDMPEQGLLVFDPKIMGNPEAMAAGTRTTTTDENGTKVTRVTGNDEGLQRSPFKPKQTWTRYAPIAMNALFGLKEMLTPADYGNADAIMAAAYQAGSPVSIGTEYIGDYRKRDPFDETYLMNIINQNAAAANRNFMNISGGNRAVAMSGILANDLITQRSLAEAARQAYLANRADDAQVAEFNRGTNQFNAQAQNTRNLSLAQLNSQRQQAMLSGISQGARLRQAIKDQRDAAISANLSAFAQGLGDLGKENGYYNMLGGLNDEGILKYFYGDNWNTKFNV